MLVKFYGGGTEEQFNNILSNIVGAGAFAKAAKGVIMMLNLCFF